MPNIAQGMKNGTDLGPTGELLGIAGIRLGSLRWFGGTYLLPSLDPWGCRGTPEHHEEKYGEGIYLRPL